MINNNTAFVQSVSLPVARPRALRRLNAVVTSIVLSLLALFGLHSLLSWQPNTVMAAEAVETQSGSTSNLKRIEGINSSKAPQISELPANALMALSPLQVADDVVTTTITMTIATGEHDAGTHHNCDGTGENYTNNEVYFGYCDNNTDPLYGGFHFPNVPIPTYASIVDAHLEFDAADTYEDSIASVIFWGDLTPGSPAFDVSLPSTRFLSTTVSSATWSITEDWSPSVSPISSPSLKDIVEEIVQQSSGQSSITVTILSEPTSPIVTGNRRILAEEYPHNPNNPYSQDPARLIITYTETRKTNPDLSTFTISPETAVADGADYVTATVTISDTYGPLANKDIALSADGPITVTWPNGNQTDANGQVIAHITSTDPETKVVSATVLNEDVTLNQTANVTFTDIPIQGLAASNSSPTFLGEATTFTATVSQGSSVEYTWDFDDGSTGTGATPSHTYAAEGTYTAVVTASNSLGAITDSTSVSIIAQNIDADLVLDKTGPATAVAGTSIDYDILVSNVGTEPASNVVVVDTLPVSSTVVTSSHAYTFDSENNTVTWQIPFIYGETSESIALELKTEVNASGTITNQVTGSMTEADPNLGDNTAEHSVTLTAPPPGPDIAVSKTGPSSVPVGFPINYNLTIVNQGGQPTTGVIVTDTLPLNTTFISSTHETFNTTYNDATRDVTFGVGTLAPGETYKITLYAQVSETAPLGNITNNITASLYETDENLTNNDNSWTTNVVAAEPSLTVQPATSGSNPAVLSVLENGASASMVMTITNKGTAALTGGFSLDDINTTWLDVAPLTFNDDLAIGESVTITFSVTDTSQAIGNYYDLITINSPNHAQLGFFLRTYVHPELTDITVPITNDLGNKIPGAQVSLEKLSDHVVVVDGEPQSNEYFSQVRVANSNGEAHFSQLETGTYNYTVVAQGHNTITGETTISSGQTQLTLPELHALPGLVFAPNQAILSVVAGEQSHFTLEVRNEGPGNATNFAVETPSDLPWISSALPYSVTQLLAGESMQVTLFLEPPLGTEDNSYQKYITVTADGVSDAVLAASIHVLTTTVGSLDFAVTGSYGEAIENAYVVVTNENGRTSGSQTIYDTQSGKTGADGTLTLENLPAGEYTYHVDANGYYLESGTVNVQPGSNSQENNNQVSTQLSEDPFTYSWTVEETTITDTYAFTVEIDYEAVAVEPLLFVSPIEFCPGNDVEFMVANVGPVTMTNILLTPSHSGITFTYGTETNSVDIGTLSPGAAFVGTFATASLSDESANSGNLQVTANYSTTAGTFDYATSARSRKHCSTGGGGSWSWTAGGGKISGSYTGGTVPSFPWAPPPASIPGNNKESATLILSGEAMLERQAFNARLELNSLSDGVIEDVTINILATDEDGNLVSGFAITPTIPTTLGNLDVGGALEGEWLIVPGDLGITDTNGVVYELYATITYEIDGVTSTVKTIPQAVTVYPQPYVQLWFSHSQPEENGDFYVEVIAENNGFGVARNLVLNVTDLATLDDLDGNGRSLVFVLKETIVSGESITDVMDYALQFGDLQPGEIITGQWVIGVGAADGTILTEQLVTGFRLSCSHKPYLGLELSPLLECGNYEQPKLTQDCPFCDDETYTTVGGPINTGNGNYDYRQSTPQVATAGNPLRFTWTYNSLNSGIDPDIPLITSTLGNGWTHNYQMTLDFSQVESSRLLVVRAPHGTPLYFHVVQDQYEPFPGVHATLDYTLVGVDRTVYTVTTGSQMTYVFSDTGRLLQQTDAHGNNYDFNYNEAGQLTRVEEPVSGRFLDFVYYPDGMLSTVTDPINRTTQFFYNPQGHLTQVIDTRDKLWQYGYTEAAPGFDLLSRVTDPDNRILEETGFDEFGRAITQTYRGQELSIVYFDDGRRLITNGLSQETTHVYNQHGLLIGVADANRELDKFQLDAQTNVIYEVDRDGNPTYYDKTPFGYTTAVTDALGYDLSLTYDDNNNWTRRIDQRGEVTLFDYDEHNNLITETNHFSDTITYTYNAFGQMTSRTDENDTTTYYGFDSLGQMTVITDSLEHTTYFEYDMIGRLITSTDVMGRVTINQYDNGDNLVKVIVNAHPTVSTPNYLDEYNLITQYGYDGMGNQIAITDTVGRVQRTFLDEFGRVVTNVVNYDAARPLCDFNDPDPEYNICSLTEYDELGRVISTTDSLGRVERTFYNELGQVVGLVKNATGLIATVEDLPSCLSLPVNRDEDVCTLFGHDVLGNSTVMTDTVGRMTRTYYDPLNRIEGMILNWDGTTTLDNCLSLPAERDQNICMMFGYDEKGNTTVMTDTLGQMSRTFYDEMGRTEATVINWNPATLSTPEDCILSPDNTSEENICTLTEYDAAGNQTVVTNALGQRTLTVYDGLNRPFINVANWDGTPILAETDCSFPPAQPDVNVCTVTYYDDQNRPESTKDPMGNLADVGYDSQGRVVTTTRYLEGEPVPTVVAYDALGRRKNQTDAEDHIVSFQYDVLNRPYITISGEGVVMTQTYDAAGRVVSTTNNLGHTTTYQYDDLDRLVKTIDAEENETTYEYDVLGNQVGIIDANSIRTTYEYDDLDRLVRVIENDTGGTQTDNSNIITEYAYDAVGNQLRIVNARGYTVTTTLYDDLYRPHIITDALQHDSSMQYNALGLQTVVTDSNGEVTRYAYDGLNRPISVTYMADNQTVNYTYNALGNRLTMEDGVGLTTYEYDDLYRPITVTQPITGQVVYDYDLVGNRTYLEYPDGRVVTYTYNADNQMTQLKDWSDTFTDYQYDVVGRLITTTLPSGVYSVNQFDDVGRLLQLTHYAADDSLLADYQYELDGIGNRQVVTETLYAPGVVDSINTFLEENGMLVLEAEKGAATDGFGGQQWLSQTVHTGFAGESYLRAMPDIGAHTEANDLQDSPMLSYRIESSTPTTYTVWVRGMASDAAGDSLHVGLDDAAAATADNLTGFQPNEWTWSRTTSDGVDANLDLSVTGTYTLNVWMREDGLRLDRLLLVTDTTYIPTGEGPAATPIQVITDTVEPGLTSHVIQYAYDDVYRLTDAVYTGDIEADYHYGYDPVGNMTAYTETVGTQTTRVTRFFDNANRLQGAFDYDAGTTSYLYDNNGNLTLIMPPGDAQWLHYGFDQRNLMISHTVSISGTNVQPVAMFAYDGNGNRVQQTDSSGSEPVTTTYINDVMGLTQVLVADDGTEQVYNLFGLDPSAGSGQALISQDDGTSSRYMLADGLGSVRIEMVDGTVESATTYDPYGNLLKQVGDTGTTYGYTGEQQDGNTGLLYLRARYYNPALRSFMGRDPWSGNGGRPQSMNGWSYVENNSVNLVDPTGRVPFPEHCSDPGNSTKMDYIECVTDAFGVFHPLIMIEQTFVNIGIVRLEDIIPQSALSTIYEVGGCYYGPVPYRGKGYYEGAGTTEVIEIEGTQIVYDFAQLKRQLFDYSTLIFSDGVLSWNNTMGAGTIYGLRSWEDVASEYSGPSLGHSVGFAPSLGFEYSSGWEKSYGFNDPTVRTSGRYWHFGLNTDIGIMDYGFALTEYSPVSGIGRGFSESYTNRDETVRTGDLVSDIIKGTGSPISGLKEVFVIRNRIFAIGTAVKYANVHNEMWKPWIARN